MLPGFTSRKFQSTFLNLRQIITDWVTMERAPHFKRRIHASSLVTGAHADDLLERESRSKRSLDLSNATICAVIAPRITVAAQSRN
ncbi:hypothetical protein BLNAU_21253 [Blattamonas nauphoetae]|uniref:Uncharacterized protein n=1 Tax=Blattamonas nauphoetae TaxID=2049346 RepID=A0ABQ9WWF7_9EUKA|nr:hypothetical protein BLNAU_21253 [Blattamonas nauphoetae]